MEKLTPIQSKALDFIRTAIADHGSPPTLRELCTYMGYKAIGSAQDVVSALRRKGYLAQPSKQAARALLLTDKARFHEDNHSEALNSIDVWSVPCLGAVPAGNPLEAIEEQVGTLVIAPELLPRPRPQAERLFALRAEGDSMIGAGIVNGDWLVIHSQAHADPGQIVVARVDGEATVKRLMQDPRGWFLQPENTQFQPIYAEDASSFEVIGRVVALQRSLSQRS